MIESAAAALQAEGATWTSVSSDCFNYPTLGYLYKYATYDALVQPRAGA